jgi:hypothetical protein
MRALWCIKWHWHRIFPQYIAFPLSTVGTRQVLARPAIFQNFCVFLKIFVLFYALFVLCRSVLFVCKCVLYNCHREATQLQLTDISYHIVPQMLHIPNLLIRVSIFLALGKVPPI